MSKEKDPDQMTREDMYGLSREDINEIRKATRDEDWANLVKRKIEEAEFARKVIGERVQSEAWQPTLDRIDEGINLAKGSMESREWSDSLQHLVRVSPDIMKGYGAGYVDKAEVEQYVQKIEENAWAGDDGVLDAVNEFRKGKELTDDKKQDIKKAARKADEE
ncbi:MAG: hypothetical protein V1921_04930 [Candidatus Altiarchaeota archaeon]